MSIEWRKPCEHGAYDNHDTVDGKPVDFILGESKRGEGFCPGGSSVTTEDIGERVPWCVAHNAQQRGTANKCCNAWPDDVCIFTDALLIREEQ